MYIFTKISKIHKEIDIHILKILKFYFAQNYSRERSRNNREKWKKCSLRFDDSKTLQDALINLPNLIETIKRDFQFACWRVDLKWSRKSSDEITAVLLPEDGIPFPLSHSSLVIWHSVSRM